MGNHTQDLISRSFVYVTLCVLTTLCLALEFFPAENYIKYDENFDIPFMHLIGCLGFIIF